MGNTLPADIQQRIDAQLATGNFVNECDVLREALEGLERRQRDLVRVREMVALADEDVSAQRIGTFDPDDVKQDVRRRLSNQGIND